MIWAIQNVARYRAETDAVTALDVDNEWFSLHKWRFDDAFRLCADGDITVQGRNYPVTLCYSQNFPFSPPSVIPQVEEQWSSHQYIGGELCLEYRSDNWVQSITGANMLESAHRLLLGEAYVPATEARGVVSDQHEVTLGQKLRYKKTRFFYTTAFEDALPTLPRLAKAKFTDIGGKSEWRVYLNELLDGEISLWKDLSIPEVLSANSFTFSGSLARLDQDIEICVEDITSFLGQVAPELLERSVEKLTSLELVLVCTPSSKRLFRLMHEKNSVFEFGTVPPTPGNRLAENYASLAAKKVAIIGCGSIGTKVATMLARSGVGGFVLVDDDIFAPENVVRNDLDWRSVGDHKVDALKHRINLVNAEATVDVRRQKLGGQEAGSTADGTLSALGGCDLIIDTSASSKAFNYGSSVAVSKNKPMIWAEVFGGGFGGLIARSRPKLDPEPQLARAQILQWCDVQGVNAPTVPKDYSIQDGETVFVADDADVSVIAAHLARYGIDLLLARSPSIFPCSAYLIGLAPQWLFSQPFDVYPIELHTPAASAENPTVAAHEDQQAFSTLLALLENKN